MDLMSLKEQLQPGMDATAAARHEIEPPKGYNELLWLWLAYFIGAENFDRQFPGAYLSSQVWLPRGDFLPECKKHAHKLQLETIDKVNLIALRLRMKAEDINAAEVQASGMYHNERIELANRLNVAIHCEQIAETWEFIKEWPILR